MTARWDHSLPLNAMKALHFDMLGLGCITSFRFSYLLEENSLGVDYSTVLMCNIRLNITNDVFTTKKKKNSYV